MVDSRGEHETFTGNRAGTSLQATRAVEDYEGLPMQASSFTPVAA
jgi:hypothetical protein